MFHGPLNAANCVCDPESGYLYAAMLHSASPVPHQNVWGRIVAICYKLLSGDRTKGLTSYLDQGYWVSGIVVVLSMIVEQCDTII